MPKYRKKPVVVEAVRWTGAIEERGKKCLSPREAFKIFVAKGWI